MTGGTERYLLSDCILASLSIPDCSRVRGHERVESRACKALALIVLSFIGSASSLVALRGY